MSGLGGGGAAQNAPSSEPAHGSLDRRLFRSNAVLMVVGTVLSQGLVFAAMPVLTRIYSAEAIGLQALFVSVAGALGVVASLRLDLAAVLPRRDRDAENLVGLVVIQGLAAGTLVVVAVTLWGDALRDLASPEASSTLWLWLLGPMVVVTTVTSGLLGLATRRGTFAAVVMSNLGLGGVFALGACALGLVGSPESGPVWARFAGQVAAALFLVGALRVSWRLFRGLGAWRRARALWAEHRQFLVYNMPYSFISVLTRDLPLFIFSVGSSVAVTAAYALARAVTLAPTVLISSALSRVFYREAAIRLGSPQLESLARSLTRAGLWISLPGFAFLLVWGDRFFEVLLGPSWTTAGEFAQRLAVPLWLALQTGWPERLFEAARRQRTSFSIQLCFDAVNAVILVTCFLMTRDPLLTVSLYAVSLTAFHVTYLTAVYVVGGFERRWLARMLTLTGSGFAVTAALQEGWRLFAGTDAVGLAVGFSASVVLTLVAGLVLAPRSRAGNDGTLHGAVKEKRSEVED